MEDLVNILAISSFCPSFLDHLFSSLNLNSAGESSKLKNVCTPIQPQTSQTFQLEGNQKGSLILVDIVANLGKKKSKTTYLWHIWCMISDYPVA